MHPYFSRHMGQHFVPVIQRHAKHGVRQCFVNNPFNFYKVFLRHIIFDTTTARSYCVRISGPLLVIAIVCSKCADGLPSSVTTVHPSLKILV